jgi:prepilin peptidase CpaA
MERQRAVSRRRRKSVNMRLGYTEWMMAMLVCAALLASWNDYRRHRVPNWLNAGLLASGLAAQTLFGGLAGLQTALAGAALGLAPLFVLWSMRAMGAGDVKYMAGLGAWLGPRLTGEALIVGGLLGGIMALAMMALQRNWRQATANMGLLAAKVSSVRTAFGETGSVSSLAASSAVLPYAIPLSIGTLWVVLSDYLGWWRVL